MSSAPILLVSVDVEEDMPGWEVQDPIQFKNIAAMPAFGDLCRELGVRPTYLCTYPVLSDPTSRSTIEDLLSRGDCELGTHLHPWNTPPFNGVPGCNGDERTRPYYLRDLGAGRFREKLEVLHALVEEVGGMPPTTFRAGRWGIDEATFKVLPEFGYTLDSSVTPLVHHWEDAGPDFRFAPQEPYFPDPEALDRRGSSDILEVPVSIGLSRKLPRPMRHGFVRIPHRSRIRGLLSRDYLRCLDFAWLYPPRFDFARMEAIARVLSEQRNPVLHVFIHSSELMAGCASEHVTTAEQVAECTERMRALLSVCIKGLGAIPATLREAEAELRVTSRSSRP